MVGVRDGIVAARGDPLGRARMGRGPVQVKQQSGLDGDCSGIRRSAGTAQKKRVRTTTPDPPVCRRDAIDDHFCRRSRRRCPLRRRRPQGRATTRDDSMPALLHVVLPVPVVFPKPGLLSGELSSGGAAVAERSGSAGVHEDGSRSRSSCRGGGRLSGSQASRGAGAGATVECSSAHRVSRESRRGRHRSCGCKASLWACPVERRGRRRGNRGAGREAIL